MGIKGSKLKGGLIRILSYPDLSKWIKYFDDFFQKKEEKLLIENDYRILYFLNADQSSIFNHVFKRYSIEMCEMLVPCNQVRYDCIWK